MNYEDPACAYCPDNVRACRVGESAERGPGFCPTKVDPDGINDAAGKYSGTPHRPSLGRGRGSGLLQVDTCPGNLKAVET